MENNVHKGWIEYNAPDSIASDSSRPPQFQYIQKKTSLPFSPLFPTPNRPFFYCSLWCGRKQKEYQFSCASFDVSDIHDEPTPIRIGQYASPNVAIASNQRRSILLFNSSLYKRQEKISLETLFLLSKIIAISFLCGPSRDWRQQSCCLLACGSTRPHLCCYSKGSER